MNADELHERAYVPGHQVRLVTVDEFHVMAQASVFSDMQPVELIEGRLYRMTPTSPRQVGTKIALHRLLSKAFGDRAAVSVNNPLQLGDLTEMRPDVTVLGPRDDGYRLAFPGAADVLLLIEVSGSGWEFDQDVKVPAYAKHGIPEVWLVGGPLNDVEVHRLPVDGKYTSVFRAIHGDILAVPGYLGASFRVDEIFEPIRFGR